MDLADEACIGQLGITVTKLPREIYLKEEIFMLAYGFIGFTLRLLFPVVSRPVEAECHGGRADLPSRGG